MKNVWEKTIAKAFKAGIQRSLYTYVHSSTSNNSRNVGTTQMSTGWWRINKMWSVHSAECYSVTKRNEALTHATTWMNLQNILQNERSQTLKTSEWMIPYKISRIGKPIATESRVDVSRGWGGWGGSWRWGGYCLVDTGFLFGAMRNFESR